MAFKSCRKSTDESYTGNSTMYAIIFFLLLSSFVAFFWTTPAKASNHEKEIPMRGLMCDTSEQIIMFMKYALNNPYMSTRLVAEEISKQVGTELACLLVDKQIPAYFEKTVETYTLDEFQVKVLKFSVKFPGQKEPTDQFMYDFKTLKELGLRV